MSAIKELPLFIRNNCNYSLWKGTLKETIDQLITQNKSEDNNICVLVRNDGMPVIVNEIPGYDISFESTGNTIIVCEGNGETVGGRISLKKNDFVFIDKSCYRIRNLYINSLRCDSACYIGQNFSSGACSLNMKEGNGIYIGSECMFATGINILNSDMHVIFDGEGRCINHGSDVIIGNHVWLCQDVKVLKGSYIADDCVVGAASVCTTKFYETHAIIAGNPARVVRHNCTWDRKSPELFI